MFFILSVVIDLALFYKKFPKKKKISNVSDIFVKQNTVNY